MAIQEEEESFTVDINGSTTGKNYKGKFKTKIWLSLGDELVRDNKRRELLGPATGVIAPEMVDLATALSELYVRLTFAPDWWGKDGSAIRDYEPAIEIYKKVQEIRQKALDAVKKEAVGSKEELSKEEPVA